jgi:hypothetical protein
MIQVEDAFNLKDNVVLTLHPDEDELQIGIKYTFQKKGESFKASVLKQERMSPCLCGGCMTPRWAILVAREEVPETIVPPRKNK